MKKLFKVGTRKSKLALVQTQIVIQKIKEVFPEIEFEVIPVSTKGDERLNQSLSSFGGKGVFTKELEELILSGAIDFAVHSAKDMPVELPDGLGIAGAMERTHCHDVLVTVAEEKHKYPDFSGDIDISGLKAGFVIGTGSLRRELQLKAVHPNLTVRSIRGNVQTRLNKLLAGDYDGIILAEAGLARLFDEDDTNFDYTQFEYTLMDTKQMLPAAAQGILAIEGRVDDEDVKAVFEKATSPAAMMALRAERSYLQAIGGGCNAPAAALAQIRGSVIEISALFSPDGKAVLRDTISGDVKNAEVLGKILANRLLSQRFGMVWLIGAGPGDSGLISVRGLECLKMADVVIYDHLAGTSLLNEVRDDAVLVYAGKQAGSHYLKQNETNDLIVQYAKEGKNVARLKGGDVFVFGRGGEEALILAQEGIDFEIVPGISSAYAVPAYQGIPVTHRGLASSFHVITGHEDEKKQVSVLNYEILAKEEGTLVFLMGLNNLENICKKLIACGKNPNTPAAVLQSGTTAHQKIAEGVLENIADTAKEKQIKTPAITIIGDVAGLHKSLNWYNKGALSGKRVLLTATKPMADDLAKKLRQEGAEPVCLSLIQTAAIESEAVDLAYQKLSSYSWAVFTSRNGVDVFFDGLLKRRIDMRSLSTLKFAAIGEGTAKALAGRGIYCDYIPEEYTSEAMAKMWVPMLEKNDNVLLLRAKSASPVLPKALKAAGINYTSVELYETIDDERKAPELLRILQDIDIVTLCSASAAKAYAKMTRDIFAGRVQSASDTENGSKSVMPKLLCIGPVTKQAAMDCGLRPDGMAASYCGDGMIEYMKTEMDS